MTGADDSNGGPVGARRREPDIVPALPLTPTGAITYWTVGLTAVLAAVVTIGAYAGTWAVLAAVVLGILLVAWGWPVLVGLPSPRGATAVIALGGALCAVAVALTDREPRLAWLAPAFAAALLLELVHQLLRRDARPRLVEGVTGTVSAVALLASFSAPIALPDSLAAADGVLTWAAAVTIALATGLLPLPGRISLPLGITLATLAGGVLGGVLDDGTVVAGLLTGAACSAVSLMLHRLLAAQPAAGQAPGWVALAVAPIASSGMVAYVVQRLALG